MFILWSEFTKHKFQSKLILTGYGTLIMLMHMKHKTIITYVICLLPLITSKR